mgnify:CR=1 FL=1
MKTLTLGLLISCISVLSSCNRNYTCSCEGPYMPDDRKNRTVEANTKKKAKKDCDELEEAFNAMYTNVSCELK